MFSLFGDLRYSLRRLRRSPEFTAVALLSLAAGIGPNTAMFSILDEVLLKKLPAREPDRLVNVEYTQAQDGVHDGFSYRAYEEFRDRSQSLLGVFAHDGTSLALTIDGAPELARGAFVSGSYYSVLGVPAVAGRVFTSQDDRPGAAPVAVIRYEYWKRRFGLDPSVIGKAVNLKGIAFTIVGATPPGFAGYNLLDPADVTIPAVWHASLALKDHTTFGIMARLAPGATAQTAAAELTVLFRRAQRDAAGTQLSPDREREIAGETIRLASASHGLWDIQAVYQFRLLLLMSAVGLLLLTASANLAGLMLARSSGRQREIAVRLAIGAGRRRLIAQMLTESVLLALCGGVLGVLLAAWFGGAVPKLLGLDIALRLSPRVLAFTTAISVATGVAFGLTPAWRASVLEPMAAMRQPAGAAGRGASGRLTKALVVVQVAMSFCLLIGTGLLMRTVDKLRAVDPGFRSDHILLGWVFPALAGYEGNSELQLYSRLLGELQSIPGVERASLARHSLMQGNCRQEVSADGSSAELVSCNAIAPAFFETMGIPLVRGRDFSAADGPASQPVAIVNEYFAREHFAGNAIGRQLRVGGPDGRVAEIIGVVRDTRYHSLRQDPRNPPRQVFVPVWQAAAEDLGQMQLVIRTPGNPGDVLPELRRRVAAINPHMPLASVTTQEEQVSASIANERSLATLTSVFGLLALLVTCVGLYGVISYSVSRRTREIGVRMALGADRREVAGLILRETLTLAGAGVAIGVPVSLAAARAFSSLLYGVAASDLVTLAAALLAVLAAAAVSGYVPARRASRVSPLAALHWE